MKLVMEFWLDGPRVRWRERKRDKTGRGRRAEVKTHTAYAPLPKNGDRAYSQGPKMPPKVAPSKRTAALRLKLC